MWKRKAVLKNIRKSLHGKLMPYAGRFLSQFVSAYRKSYSTNHVSNTLIEDWRKDLGNDLLSVTVLADYLKRLTVSNRASYSQTTLLQVYFWHNDFSQNVKINSSCNMNEVLFLHTTRISIRSNTFQYVSERFKI